MRSIPGLAAEATTSWPSPAEGYYDGPLSLDQHLITNPPATFVLRINGHGLRSIGITHGDEIIIDRSLPAVPGQIIVVIHHQQHRAGRYTTHAGHAALATDDHTVPLDPSSTFWGVATHAIHHLTAQQI